MKIFADMHHAGLFYSFHLTFEKRLGYELYRPIGMEWFTEGFWDIAKPYDNNPGTVAQYLDIGSQPVDKTPPLNQVMGVTKTGYRILDEFHGYEQKAILLEEFKNTKFDIIIASIPDHYITYERLRKQYQPQAKLICQMGNIGWEQSEILKQGIVRNLLASVKPFQVPNTTNALFYYQEQPVEHYTTSYADKLSIKSFTHLLPLKEQYEAYKTELQDVYDVRAYGSLAPDGLCSSLQDVYDKMRESNFVYHVKPGGDGYGWNWHSAFMLGRPILTNFSDYKDKLGGILFEDMVTGIDLEKRTVHENSEILKKGMDELSRTLGAAARKKWEKTVDYETQAYKIKEFLTKLI